VVETVDCSHIMLTQLAWIAKTGRRLRRDWQLLEKFDGLVVIYLDLAGDLQPLLEMIENDHRSLSAAQSRLYDFGCAI
jgi:hypothetical protein